MCSSKAFMLSQQRVGRLALTAASCPLLHGSVVWARAFTVRHTFLLSSVVARSDRCFLSFASWFCGMGSRLHGTSHVFTLKCGPLWL